VTKGRGGAPERRQRRVVALTPDPEFSPEHRDCCAFGAILTDAAPADCPKAARLAQWGIAAVPTISMFFGIVVLLYYRDDRRHHRPHIHARHQDREVVVAIDDSEVLEGSLPLRQMRLLLAWIEIHREDLLANWDLAVQGLPPFRIPPLR
jgi:hypothetical protein